MADVNEPAADVVERVARAMGDAIMFDGDRLRDWLDIFVQEVDDELAPVARAAIAALATGRDDNLAGTVKWLREKAESCKKTCSEFALRDDDEISEEWRVRGETFAFIADQIEKGHSPLSDTALRASTDERLREVVTSTSEWLDDFSRLDLSEIAADGGITSGTVVQHEAKWRAAKLRRALKDAPDA